MWPYTDEENDMLSKKIKVEESKEMHPMDWAEIYGHENFRKVLEK